MPKYEFKCPQCGNITEVNSPEDEHKCFANHDGVLMKRIYGLGGISFKGSGFYSKDK